MSTRLAFHFSLASVLALGFFAAIPAQADDALWAKLAEGGKAPDKWINGG